MVRSHEHSLQKKVRQQGLKCALSVRAAACPSQPPCCHCKRSAAHRACVQPSLWHPAVTSVLELVQAKAAEGRLTVVDSLALEAPKTVTALPNQAPVDMCLFGCLVAPSVRASF